MTNQPPPLMQMHFNIPLPNGQYLNLTADDAETLKQTLQHALDQYSGYIKSDAHEPREPGYSSSSLEAMKALRALGVSTDLLDTITTPELEEFKRTGEVPDRFKTPHEDEAKGITEDEFKDKAAALNRYANTGSFFPPLKKPDEEQ